MAMGSQNANISHQVPAAASQMRRPRRPQLPPVVYCSISRQSDPVVRPSQNMKAKSQERRNKSVVLGRKAPTRTGIAARIPMGIARDFILVMMGGGAKSCGVMRVAIPLMALHLPAAGGPWG